MAKGVRFVKAAKLDCTFRSGCGRVLAGVGSRWPWLVMAGTVGTSIRLKLALFVAAVVIVLAASLSWVSYIFAHRTLSQQIDDRLSIVVLHRRQLLLDYVSRQKERVALVASRTRLRELLADAMATADRSAEGQRILTDALRTSPDFLELSVTDLNGRVVMATESSRLGEDWSARPEFQVAAREPWMSRVVHRGGRHEAVATAPVVVAEQPVGVVWLRSDATPLLRMLSDASGLGDTGEVLVAALEDGVLHFLLPNRQGCPIPDMPATAAPIMARALAGQAGYARERDYRGEEVLAAFLPVPQQGWGIVAKMDAEEGYAPIAWLRRMFVIVELSVLALGLVAAYVVARRFTNPIRRMANMAEAIANGGWDARVMVESEDEIGALARAFNKMTEEVAHSQAVLEERVRARTGELEAANTALQSEVRERQRAEEGLARQQALLQGLMDNIPDHIYFKDEHSRFIRVNKAMSEWVGLKNPAEAEGKTDYHIFSNEHAQQAFEDEQGVMRTGQPIVGREERETWPDGRVTWVSTTKLPLRDKNGRIIGTFGLSRDVTARKQAEQRLEKYAHALTRRTIQTQEDLVLAREIQMAFLPAHYPTFPRGVPVATSAVRFAHQYQPASTLGGDFFDVVALSDTLAGVLICDVMGHGMRSALVTAILRGLVNEWREYAAEPGEFLTRINTGLLDTLQSCGTPIFATAFYLVLDTDSGRVRYANAGHPSPLVLRRERLQVEVLRGSGAALGLFRETQLATQETVLAAGDSVLLFTDGLYEAPGPDGEPFGQARLVTAVRERLEQPAARLLTELIAVAREFTPAGDFDDDVCLVTAELVRVTERANRNVQPHENVLR